MPGAHSILRRDCKVMISELLWLADQRLSHLPLTSGRTGIFLVRPEWIRSYPKQSIRLFLLASCNTNLVASAPRRSISLLRRITTIAYAISARVTVTQLG